MARHFRQLRDDLGRRYRQQKILIFGCKFYRAALQRELLLRPLGNTLYFMPPYILDDDEAVILAEGAVAALEAALESSPRPLA
jgi:adenosylmethionine-8-amino-7-oxononanoate aminotransferase